MRHGKGGSSRALGSLVRILQLLWRQLGRRAGVLGRQGTVDGRNCWRGRCRHSWGPHSQTAGLKDAGNRRVLLFLLRLLMTVVIEEVGLRLGLVRSSSSRRLSGLDVRRVFLRRHVLELRAHTRHVQLVVELSWGPSWS